MKARLIVSSASVALLTVTLCCAFQQTASAQPQATIESLLIGKWRQQVGPYITETVYVGNGRFTSITRDQFTSFYSEGRWEVRNDMVIAHFTNWWPRQMRNVDGSTTEVRMPEWESSWVRFLDNDRVENKLGIAYRVR